ncbi:hypothetical protein HMPREF1398_00940 [Helicobacter pylori GAM117Ai]|nr:hypothetical protein HMPREF1398_00940 [Helicobacter pylori GAM117Ai]
MNHFKNLTLFLKKRSKQLFSFSSYLKNIQSILQLKSLRKASDNLYKNAL